MPELAGQVDPTTLKPMTAAATSQSFDEQMRKITLGFDREAAKEQFADEIEERVQAEREAKMEVARITAPITRAGYLVAIIVALLLFWFMAHFVFQDNPVATGALLVFTVLFFLYILKQTLEKKGARYIGETGGVALGVV